MATPTRVQYVSNGATAQSLTLAITATSGNLLLVVASASAGGISTPSDGVNTYTALTGNTLYNAAWYAEKITGGALSIVVTCTSGGIAIGVLEVSGASTTAPIDEQAAAAFTTTTSPSSGATAAATSASHFVVGLIALYGSATETITSPTFVTALGSQNNETIQVGGAGIRSAVICSNGPIAGLNTETFSGTVLADTAGVIWCLLIAPVPTVIRPHVINQAAVIRASVF